MNCWVLLIASDGAVGLTESESSCGGFTVRVVLPEMPLNVAVMEVCPVLTLAANPPLLMVATDVAEEAHVAEEVRFCVVLLL